MFEARLNGLPDDLCEPHRGWTVGAHQERDLGEVGSACRQAGSRIARYGRWVILTVME